MVDLELTIFIYFFVMRLQWAEHVACMGYKECLNILVENPLWVGPIRRWKTKFDGESMMTLRKMEGG